MTRETGPMMSQESHEDIALILIHSNSLLTQNVTSHHSEDHRKVRDAKIDTPKNLSVFDC